MGSGQALRIDGAEVRKRRLSLPGGASLRDVAARCRLSIGSLSRIENGLQRARPAAIERLASVLRCPPTAIVVKGSAPMTDRQRIEALEARVSALEARLRRTH
jgi:transcriptional regulator with XRE-family HTH domain